MLKSKNLFSTSFQFLQVGKRRDRNMDVNRRIFSNTFLQRREETSNPAKKKKIKRNPWQMRGTRHDKESPA
jgi:hypothetical protein